MSPSFTPEPSSIDSRFSFFSLGGVNSNLWTFFFSRFWPSLRTMGFSSKPATQCTHTHHKLNQKLEAVNKDCGLWITGMPRRIYQCLSADKYYFQTTAAKQYNRNQLKLFDSCAMCLHSVLSSCQNHVESRLVLKHWWLAHHSACALEFLFLFPYSAIQMQLQVWDETCQCHYCHLKPHSLPLTTYGTTQLEGPMWYNASQHNSNNSSYQLKETTHHIMFTPLPSPSIMAVAAGGGEGRGADCASQMLGKHQLYGTSHPYALVRMR